MAEKICPPCPLAVHGDYRLKLQFQNNKADQDPEIDWQYFEQVIAIRRYPSGNEWGATTEGVELRELSHYGLFGNWLYDYYQREWQRTSVYMKLDEDGVTATISVKLESCYPQHADVKPHDYHTLYQAEFEIKIPPAIAYRKEGYYPFLDAVNVAECELTISPVPSPNRAIKTP